MTILHINFSDFYDGGGGAVAMHRLHSGLKRAGVDSRILCSRKTTASADSAVFPSLSNRLEFHLSRALGRLGLNDLHGLGAFRIKRHPFYKSADVLNFHILHSGYFSYPAIARLTRERPAVYTLHDMWSFTGHCSYSYDCSRWKTGCGRCPHLDVYPSARRDATRTEWKLKRWSMSRSRLSIVSPSRWLADLVKDSFLGHLPLHYIPNGIDLDAYRRVDRRLCREALGISVEKKVLLFGALKLDDFRKGADLLLKGLASLPDSLKRETLLLFFGRQDADSLLSAGIPAYGLGYVSSDRMKSIIYSAADLLLYPSRADNLPLILQESMACETPAVSFRVGGVPDLVRHGTTGYLAAPEDVSEFSRGIVELLEDERLRQRLGQQCRQIMVEEYSLDLQVQRYIELYGKLLG